jgi:hypothetical protein
VPLRQILLLWLQNSFFGCQIWNAKFWLKVAIQAMALLVSQTFIGFGHILFREILPNFTKSKSQCCSELMFWKVRGPFLTTPLGANFDPRVWEPIWLSGKMMEWENKGNQKIPGSLPSPGNLKKNFDPRAKLSPRRQFCPLGVKVSVRPSILLNSRECSPNISPLGAKFTPVGQGWS